MAYYNDGKVFRNLPEQVEKNKSDIESIQDAQKTDESNINTNLNNINAHETRINALESLKMTQDGQNIKLTKSTGEIGNIAVGTVGGTNLLGGNDVTFKTINGESITGDGNLVVDTDLSSLLWANLGIGRWANQTLVHLDYQPDTTFTDSLASNYTNYTKYLAYSKWNMVPNSVTFANDLGIGEGSYFMYGADWNSTTVYLPNGMFYSPQYMICNAKIGKLLVKEGCTFYISGYCSNIFRGCATLTEIGNFDLSGASTIGMSFIYDSPNVKSIHCKHFKVSFSISPSTAFEESDLVEIISNLDTVSNGAVLTMGTTNLNKLTTDEISVATGKGWTLA